MVAIEPIEEILEAGESLQLQTEDASLSPAVVGSEKSKGNLGDLLYGVHSKHFTSVFGRREETDLKFYEHAVVATHTSQLCCLPKSYEVNVIPRFKIVDATITLGPRSIPKFLCFIIVVIAALLITFGTMNGGCDKACYWGECYQDSGACASLTIGALMISVLLPLIILIPWLLKWQYIYFDVRKPASATSFFNRGGIITYAFRLKKTGSDVRSDVVFFDQSFVLNYVYGSLSLGGNQTTNEAHLLSHFNNASLATPIMPVYADKTVGELVVPKLLQRKPYKAEAKTEVAKSQGGATAAAPGTPPLTPVASTPTTYKQDIYE